MKSSKIIIGLLFIGLFVILIFIFTNNIYIKSNTIEDNKIIYKNIDENEMAEIYFADFMNTIDLNIEEAYKLLAVNEMSYNDFLNYVDNLYAEGFNESEDKFKMKSYKIKKYDNYKLFYVKDYNDRTYIFKENSIMNYKVYFNENNIK